jgi:hypothetical protein
MPRVFHSSTTVTNTSNAYRKGKGMSIVAWIIVGLIPGFLAGALAAHKRQTARAETGTTR